MQEAVFEEDMHHRYVDTPRPYNNLGIAYGTMGEYQKAVENHLKSLELEMAAYGKIHPLVAISYSNLGLAYYKLEEYDEAIECHLSVQKIFISSYGYKHPDTAHALNNLGLVYLSLGQHDKALEAQLDALDIRKLVYKENYHLDLRTSYNNLEKVYERLGKQEKAKEARLAGQKIVPHEEKKKVGDLLSIDDEVPVDIVDGRSLTFSWLEKFAEPMETRTHHTCDRELAAQKGKIGN